MKSRHRHNVIYTIKITYVLRSELIKLSKNRKILVEFG